MISDEEMARKLQNEEEEEDKVRRKLMEEEVRPSQLVCFRLLHHPHDALEERRLVGSF